MNAKQMFIASIVFFAFFTGANQFQQGFYDGQGVDTNQSMTEINRQYDKLDRRVSTLREDVRAISSPETSILDSVVAGLYLVPDFLSLIMAPITILNATIDTITATYVFIPGFVGGMLKLLIIITVTWSAFRLLIGLRG